MTGYKFEPQEFANAYIQTLEHKGTVEDFDTAQEYLDTRLDLYFTEYRRAYAKAIEFHQNMEKRNAESVEW